MLAIDVDHVFARQFRANSARKAEREPLGLSGTTRGADRFVIALMP
jgi:hypothetical protein